MSRKLRLASYNVEWFTGLFDDDGQFLNDSSPSVRHGTTKAQQFAAIGTVFQALDADGIMVIEAPDTNGRRSCRTALENFARHFGLRANRAVTGFVSETEQEIAFLFDPARMTARHAPMGDAQVHAPAPRFDVALHVKIEDHPETIAFSKPPLELHLELPQGPSLRLIGVHVKSKAVRDAAGQAEFARMSIQNRRKQLAECFWIRARVDQLLAQGHSLIVMGDFNDGPGLDEYERIFGYSSVEVVAGLAKDPKGMLTDPNAAQNARIWNGIAPTSSRFWLAHTKGFFEAMLDYIMISSDLAASRPEWRIWHPLQVPAIIADSALSHALLTASDHFPVTIDIELPIKIQLA